jgi:hypothetical protein
MPLDYCDALGHREMEQLLRHSSAGSRPAGEAVLEGELRRLGRRLWGMKIQGVVG